MEDFSNEFVPTRIGHLDSALLNEMDVSVDTIRSISDGLQQSEDRPVIACDLETRLPRLGPFKNAKIAAHSINQMEDFHTFATTPGTQMSQQRWFDCREDEIIVACRLQKGWGVMDRNATNRMNAVRDVLHSTDKDMKNIEESVNGNHTERSDGETSDVRTYSKASAFLWKYTDEGYAYESHAQKSLDPIGRMRSRQCEVFEIPPDAFDTNDFVEWSNFHAKAMTDLYQKDSKLRKMDPIRLARYSGSFFMAVENLEIARKIRSMFPFPARIIPFPTDDTMEAAKFRFESLRRIRRYIREGLTGGSLLDDPGCGPVYVYSGCGTTAVATRYSRAGTNITEPLGNPVADGRGTGSYDDPLHFIERVVGTALERPILSLAEGKSSGSILRCTEPDGTKPYKIIGRSYLRGTGPKFISDIVVQDDRSNNIEIPGLHEVARCCCLKPELHASILSVMKQTTDGHNEGIPVQSVEDLSRTNRDISGLTTLYDSIVRTRVMESIYGQPARSVSGSYVYDFDTFSRRLRSNDAYAKRAYQILNANQPGDSKTEDDASADGTRFLGTLAGALTVLEKRLVRVAWILFLKDVYRQRLEWTQAYVLRENEQRLSCHLCRSKVLGNPWRCLAAISKTVYFSCDRDPHLKTLCNLGKMISVVENKDDRRAVELWDRAKDLIRSEVFGCAQVALIPRYSDEVKLSRGLNTEPVNFMADPYNERVPRSSTDQSVCAFKSMSHRDPLTYYKKDDDKMRRLFDRFHRAYLTIREKISSLDSQLNAIPEIEMTEVDEKELANFQIETLIRSVGSELYRPLAEVVKNDEEGPGAVIEKWVKLIDPGNDDGTVYDLQSKVFSDTLIRNARKAQTEIQHPLFINPSQNETRDALSWQVYVRNTLSELIILREFISTLETAKEEGGSQIPVDAILQNCNKSYEDRADILIESILREQFAGRGIEFDAYSTDDGKSRTIRRSDSKLIKKAKEAALSPMTIPVQPNPDHKKYDIAQFKPFTIQVVRGENLEGEDNPIKVKIQKHLQIPSLDMFRVETDAESKNGPIHDGSTLTITFNLAKVNAGQNGEWSHVFMHDSKKSVNTLKERVLHAMNIKMDHQLRRDLGLHSIREYSEFELQEVQDASNSGKITEFNIQKINI